MNTKRKPAIDRYTRASLRKSRKGIIDAEFDDRFECDFEAEDDSPKKTLIVHATDRADAITKLAGPFTLQGRRGLTRYTRCGSVGHARPLGGETLDVRKTS